MYPFTVTIVDARAARPRSLGAIIEKPRIHSGQQGATHRLLWLISPWQQIELRQAMTQSAPSPNEEIVVSNASDDPRGKVSDLLRSLTAQLTPGSRVLVASYDPAVTDLANSWQGALAVQGWPMVNFRTALSLYRPSFSIERPPLEIDPSLVEQALQELTEFLRLNAVCSQHNSINVADVIPAVRIRLPRLKNMSTTGLASTVVKLGVQRGILVALGSDLWLSETAAGDATTPPDPRPAERAIAATTPPVPDSGQGAQLTPSDPVSCTPVAGGGPTGGRREKGQMDWSDILKVCRLGLGARSNETMCRILGEMIAANGAVIGGEVTQYELRKRLEQKLRAENIEAFQDAEWKIARSFCNRLAESGSLLDSSRKPINPDDASAGIAGVERDFKELIEEWVILAIARGEPGGQPRPLSRNPSVLNALAHLLLGSGSSQMTQRIEAAIERLLIKNRLTEDRQGKLHFRPPPGLISGEDTASA